jgi:hypothetical protein
MTEDQKAKLRELEGINNELCKIKENNALSELKGVGSVANLIERENAYNQEFHFRRECNEPIKLLDIKSNLIYGNNQNSNNISYSNSNNYLYEGNLNYNGFNLVDTNVINNPDMCNTIYNYPNPNLNYNNVNTNLDLILPMFNSNFNTNFNSVNQINPYLIPSQNHLQQQLYQNENEKIVTFAEKIQENYNNKEKNANASKLSEFDKIVDSGKLLLY